MLDLYQIAAGPELDRIVHERVLPSAPSVSIPFYSTDEKLAKRVYQEIRRRIDSTVVIGKTRSKNPRRYFARYGSDPSTSTEVLAETLPLAICRMAALRLRH